MTLTTTAPAAGAGAAEVAAPSALLRVADLGVTYRTARGSREAVVDAAVDVAPGEFVTVVGESGSGKSTLVQAALGLLPANGRITRGRIEYSGVDVSRWSDRRLSRVRGSYVGFVPQDPGTALNPTKRVGRQVLEAVALNEPASAPRTAAERVGRALESLEVAGLADVRRVYEQYPHELSGGMRQRVLIAIALAGSPRLVVADEPTSALDVTVQRVILDHLGSLRRDLGIGVLLVTHDLGVALDRSDRVVVMHQGRVVEHGRAADVLQAPQDPYTQRLLAAAPTRASVRLLPADRVVPPSGVVVPAPEAAGPVLTAEAVTRTFHVGHGGTRRTVHAVAGVDLTVLPGRTHAIVGESGAGKSTLARLLVGIGTPDTGHVRVGGVQLDGLSRQERREVHRDLQFVYQNPFTSLDPRFSVERLVGEPLRSFRVGSRAAIRERVVELLDQVALDPSYLRQRPGQLSGGQRQRVAIARALALEPRTIVLDEPVSALDVSVQAQILQLLVDLQARLGLSYVLITHDLGVVRLVGDDVTVMKDGVVVETGTVDDVFAAPRHEYTRRLLDAVPGRGR